ncbi:MAG: T9SS type A sorting domain-containing protein [Bacteroidetes bacterium]|nr:T9SS type A sorting domain-containing protein [Bacteroidota bacterium]
MKQRYLALMLVLFWNPTGAQNWTLVNPDYSYHYVIKDSLPPYPGFDPETWIFTITTDSHITLVDRTILYMNRIVQPDSIQTRRSNIPTFLQKRIIKTIGGYSFRDTSSFFIDAKADSGSTWIFDTTSGKLAIIVDLYTSEVLEETDSIKVIVVSNIDTILISKKHGIIRFPLATGKTAYYQLIGINGLNQGIQIPLFKDYFDFDEGDIFEYYYRSETSGINQLTGIKRITQYRIIEDISVNNRIRYIVEGFRSTITTKVTSRQGKYEQVEFKRIKEVIEFIDTSTHYLNKFLLQPYQKTNGELVLPFYGIGFCDSTFHTLSIDLESPPVYQQFENDILKCINCGDVSESNLLKFAPGIGLYYQKKIFEGGFSIDSLVAVRKAAWQCGQFTTNLGYLPGQQVTSEKNEFNPNPFTITTTLYLEKVMEETRLFVYDIFGRVNIDRFFRNTDRIEINKGSMEAGLYFYKVVNGPENVYLTGKLMVK